MDRSLYPEGVEVRQSDLKNTEDTRTFHILKRHVDNATLGVVSGLLVTPNGPNVDIAPGYGYAPNGELVELDTGVVGIELAVSSIGIKNFILAVYTETNDRPRPHETSGDSFPTEANRSVRISVLSESQYNLLTVEDSNLNNDSYNRSMVVAVVTAQGSGINLVPSNIELPSNFGGGVDATVTGSPIPGVSILRVDDTTPTGTGNLEYVTSSGELTWVAPDDTSGVAAIVSSGGVFELASQPSNTILTVLVMNTLLPTSDDSATVAINNIYVQDVCRHTSKDDQHRSFIGSGVPTATNPHGLTPGDLGLGETNTEFHQEVFHANGISPDSAPGFLEPIINTGGIPHSIDFIPPIAGDKLYLGGFYHNTINGSILQFTDITDNAQILFNTYAVIGNNNSIATLEKRERVRYVSIPPPPLSVVAQLRDISDSCPAGTAQFEWGGAGDVRFKAPGDTSFGEWIDVGWMGPSPGLIRLFNETSEHFIDIYANEESTWGSVGAAVEDLLVTALPSISVLNDRFKISATMYSGSGTGFLGNGFNPANGPNDPNDKRVTGLTDGEEIKAGFHSFGSGGNAYLNSSGRISIGMPEQPHPNGRLVCLTLGQRNDNTATPLKIQQIDTLPSNLTYQDRGSVFMYNNYLYLWYGNGWRAM